MKTLWILAAAATFAACHNRSSDETGAAPDRGDSTMTTIDTTNTAPSPSASGYDTTAAPSMPSDTTAGVPAPESGIDTTSTTNSQNPPSGQSYDTTSTSVPSPSVDSSSTAAPSTGVDTTSGSMQTDSSMSAPTSTDSSSQR
jgi:hypothetical protein